MTEAVAEALQYLEDHNVLTLATDGPAGLWAAALFYASRDLSLYFLSAADTRHASNLAHQPRCAATIQEDYNDWRQIRGIQLEGSVSRLAGGAREVAMALYFEKFPFLTQAPQPLQRALESVDWYELTPDRLYFIDNRRAFGHRDRIL